MPVYKERASSFKGLTPAHAGYVAGMLDGEGHLYIRGEYEGVCYSRIRVRITDECVVKHLKKITGIGTITSHMPKKRRKDGGPKRRVYEWTVGVRAEVKDLLTAIMPFLVLKKRRAELLMEFESLKTQGISSGADVRAIITLIAEASSPERA